MPFVTRTWAAKGSGYSSSTPGSVGGSEASSAASTNLTINLSVLFAAAVKVDFYSGTFFDAGHIYNVIPSWTSAADAAPSAVHVVHSASPPGSTYPNISVVLAHIPLCYATMFFTGVIVPHSFSVSLRSVTHSVDSILTFGMSSYFGGSSAGIILP